MKRREVIKELEEAGFLLKRDTGKHSVYFHPDTKRTELVAHGREIPETTAREIIRRVKRVQ